MLVALLAAVAAAVVALTFLQTRSEYATLPDRVPMHVRLDGAVDKYGPRASVWLLPAVQVVCVAVFIFTGFELATGAPGAHGSLLGMAAFAPCVLAILWRAQMLLISAAKMPGQRTPVGGFWLFFSSMMAAGLFAVLFL